MSGSPEATRQIFMTLLGNDCFVVIKPPLEPEEKENFPAAHFRLYTSLETVADNGSQIIALPDYRALWQWQEHLEDYVSRIARHLGNCMLDSRLYHVHPETIFAEEPAMTANSGGNTGIARGC